ncbi:GTPase-activating protein and VPS9 domain-containing protein 1-like [Mya arenaria]|nr:GTPase-activating protein and VPS9 domain-containing protein 1-like [Mya arenaria]
MALGPDLAQLSRHLRQERLYVTSEREQLQSLYEQVKTAAEQLYHQSWIGRQQKTFLDLLVSASQQVTPTECCAKTSQLEATNFIDSYKQLSYHDSKYGEFLKYILDNPVFIGTVIAIAEKSNVPNVADVIKTLVRSVFGNCILQEDETAMLHVLKSLLELQLSSSVDPRRLLRRGSCAFSVAFKQLFDMVFSAKLFLTAALHDPVMRLLMEDEWFYDIDPGKALVRFPPAERLRRFGEPGTDQYKEKLVKYRTTIVDKLVLMANRFITSIKNNMHCFPQSLGWIVSQVYQVLAKSGKAEMGEVRSVCADLVFALFICPAICDPEPHGITTDVPISHIARHNLMQMAQIIQVLAISQWEEIDPKLHDLYGKFEKGCMSTLLDSLLDGIGMELPSVTSSQLPCLSRTSSLITLRGLNQLVTFMRAALPFVEDSSDRKALDEMLAGLVPITPVTPVMPPQGMLPCASTPPGTPSTAKKMKGKKKPVLGNQMPDDAVSVSSVTIETEALPSNAVEEVLVISLGNDQDCPGMMSEQKVMVCEQENKRRRVKHQTVQWDYEGPPGEIQEKRTRFSLSHDQESIGEGNTSDIPEGMSEDASSHSVGSQDLENEDDNDDNFSDMISANVSGRGTPNISGRDTPLSQAEMEQEHVHVPPIQPALPETVRKKNREDVTDKFGKFDIKPELDYDLKSTVSDTWSTDVLASDSEPPEMPQQVRLEEIAEEMSRQFLTTGENVPGLSKAPSEAWSMDVMPSDTEDKQCETFSELDDMSVGGGGSNLDDVRSEPDTTDGNEITPLASGFQSPTDTAPVDIFSTGRAGRQGTSINSDNISMSPTFSDSVFSDIDVESGRNSREPRAISGPAQGNMQFPSIDSNKLFVPIKKKRGQSPSGSSPDRNSETGSTRNRLVDFDLEPRYESYQHRPASDTGILNGARPKQIFNDRNRNHKNVVSNFKTKDSSYRFNGVNSVNLIPDEIRPISNDSGVGSTQYIDAAPSDDVRILEQQNTNVDETRFSAALSLFDPLAEGEGLGGGDLLEGPSSPHERSPFQGFSNPNFVEVATNAILPNSRGKNKSDNADLPSRTKEQAQSATLIDTGDVFLQTDGPPKPRRGSTDSNRSSGSSLSKDGSNSGDRASLQNEKELSGEQDGATPGKKRGLFRTFREKIHKVVDVTQQTAAESTNTLVDSEGAVGGDTTDKAAPEPNIVITETSDDILAKYRKKSILTSAPSSEPAQSERALRLTLKENDDSTPLYDPDNLEKCLAFLDAKRKLRIVLGSADFQQVGYSLFCQPSVPYSPREVSSTRDNDLVNMLRAQLSEAINLQNKDTIAQLHEALRCVRQFDNEGCKKLVRSLQEDYRTRASYISYLVRCKQGLLCTLSHLRKLQDRARREKEIYNKHMTSVCIRMFLETWEKALQGFIQDFQKLTMADEKVDLLERFLQYLYQKMNVDSIWLAANESQLEDGQLAIERYIMSRIYTHAMFPNGDGDIHRDQLFQAHIKELSKMITPEHKDLTIPKMYHLECPWPAAQRELYMINAYKTPRDKLYCIQRCATTIMNLLSMANEKSVPAADEFTPVFIFVIIKANPPCLLSTIQYVTSLYQDRLQGEEQYWWMQFVAAVEFIKTMDYPRDSSA